MRPFASIGNQPFSVLDDAYRETVIKELGRQGLTKIYRQLLLSVISNLWVEYLTQVEALRVSIGLEAYAQRDPLVQYKNKAFEMFQDLLRDMRLSVVTKMFTFRVRERSAIQASINRDDADSPQPETGQKQAEPQTKKKKKTPAETLVCLNDRITFRLYQYQKTYGRLRHRPTSPVFHEDYQGTILGLWE